MSVPSMIDVSELAGFPGAETFTQEMVENAVAAIRGEVGWHIAPVISETVTVLSSGGRTLFLPSLRVVSVDSVEFNGFPVLGWSLYPGGMLYRSGIWPCGAVEVTLTHGYDAAPDLASAVAARLDGYTRGDRVVTSRTDGPFTETYSTETGAGDPGESVLSRYRIPVVG